MSNKLNVLTILFRFEKDAVNKYTPRPLMFHHPPTETTPRRISLQYGRRYFVGFGELPRNPEIPPITEAQAEALDALHFLGEKFCVNTHFAKGDMQFVNNFSLFHARDGFLDGEGQRYVWPTANPNYLSLQGTDYP